MRKIAKIAGFVIVTGIALVYLMIVVGGWVEGELISFDFESLGMVVLSALAITSVVVAFLRVELGGWLLLGVGVLFTIFALITAGGNYLMAVMGAGGPLILGSVLILLSIYPKKKGDQI